MTTLDALQRFINEQRTARGFLSIEEMLRLVERENVILDVFSTLISKECEIGRGNVFYPNTILECRDAGSIEIGSENVFHPGCFLLADSGKIRIGDGNQFGDGGFAAKANRKEAWIEIGNVGRYLNGASVLGNSRLGSGSQVIGGITVQDCELGGGNGFLHPDPNERGAVLKGNGLARALRLMAGDVINAYGTFSQECVERQAAYHPNPQRGAGK